MSGGNLMSMFFAIPPLNGNNYHTWREKVELALALSENDIALTSPCPTKPMELVKEENEADAAFATRQRDHESVRMKYDLERTKWDSSNHKCLMVFKATIEESIRGSIPECTTATEFLEKVKRLFTGSTKYYAITLLKKLVCEKYTSGGIREHLLEMSNAASELKTMDIGLKDDFLLHLIFASLPKEYEAFVINYNFQPENWNIAKLIAMCVQEEERLKSSQGDSANYVKDNKRKNFNRNAKRQGKPQWNRNSSKSQGKAPRNDRHQKNNQVEVDKDTCWWCHKKGHYQQDCPQFLKHLLKKGIPYEEDPAKRRKIN